jgi:hypothetical protein
MAGYDVIMFAGVVAERYCTVFTTMLRQPAECQISP